MQFPRIKFAVTMTLLYYEKTQILTGVGQFSKDITRAGITFNGQLMPRWDVLVLDSHQGMEEEIKQIISLNYPHVHSIVFEDLREVLQDIRLKSLNKQIILDFADKNNEEQRQHLLKYPQGFAVMVNKDFLPQYFEVVENAINNLKRIINKYLKLYDANKLPKGYPLPDYVPIQDKQFFIENDHTISKIKISISYPQLAALFSAFRELGIISEKGNTELARQIAVAFSTKGTADINVKKLAEQIAKPDAKALDHWLDQLKEIRIALTNLKHPNN